MKVSRLVKKFKHQDHHEERVMAHALVEGEQALEVIVKYLAMHIDGIDKELNNTSRLYSNGTESHLYVAALLARREASMNLLLLLTEKIELDVDQTKE